MFDISDYKEIDWTSSELGHIDGKVVAPPNAPNPQGLCFTINAQGDADQKSEKVTRRSRTKFWFILTKHLCVGLNRNETV